MARPLFRKGALARLASPDRLDLLMQVTSPRAWIALLALALLLLSALAWGLFGSIATTAEGKGVLLHEVVTLSAPEAGKVQKFLLRSGEGAEKDQVLVLLANGEGKTVSVHCPVRARVLGRSAKVGEAVKPGDALLTLEPTAEPLRARLYVPVGEGYQIQPGMAARVWPASVKRDEFGFLVGKVVSASKFPISRAEMLERLKSEDLVSQLAAGGPILQIIAELTPDPRTVSGYRWSSSQGSPQPLYSGTPCEARIVLGEYWPLHFVFPTLGGPEGGSGTTPP